MGILVDEVVSFGLESGSGDKWPVAPVSLRPYAGATRSGQMAKSQMAWGSDEREALAKVDFRAVHSLESGCSGWVEVRCEDEVPVRAQRLSQP